MIVIERVPLKVVAALGILRVRHILSNPFGLAVARDRAQDSDIGEPQRKAYADLVALLEGSP